MRLDRQGWAGRSVRSKRPCARAISRTPALSIPASTKGWTTCILSAAKSPGMLISGSN
jgi:hypothetical protein